MWWRGIFGSPWLGIVGFVSLVWGIPGMREDAAEWRSWFGVMNTGWFYATAAAGTVLFCFWLLVVVERHWGTIRTYWKEFASLAAMVLMICIIGGLIYYTFFIYERTKTVWTHPTLSAADQERAKAKCRIAAYDAIGAGRGGLKDPTPVARSNYVRDCLISKGFTFIEVRESESDGQL